ncbi:Outer membrane protein TolC [Desulfuromusa kysingii]|uniref:Outer membrane protein TolC n=1 Tax=Desulfuromusa kysingii TaxID=37625 RepID=A0A1H4EBU5_9BACT|nr:TolC family protein [Desulfuromusa kysingii]SEA82060.1 Outer membrane protein TolC [Desulfuromusa kysingii]
MFYSLRRTGLFVLFLITCSVSSVAAIETLSFQAVLASGLENSFDSRINAENINASRAAVIEAKADYYPQLSLRFGQAYVHVYDEYSSVASVGDTVYSDSISKYKHSLSFYAQYNLFDFGRRKLGVNYAKQQVNIAESQNDQSRFENSQSLLALYVKALKLQKQIAVQQNILNGRKRIFNLIQQLLVAGKYGHQDVGDAAIMLAQSVSHLDQLRVDLQSILDNISFYTRRFYAAEKIHLADFEVSASIGDTAILTDKLPELRILEEQIARKETELAIARRELFPRLTLTGSYGMYGSNDNSYSDSLEQMSQRDANVTLSLVMPIFDGFAAKAKKQRLQHEMLRLKVEKEKTLADLGNRVSAAQRSFCSLQHLNIERSQQKRQIVQQVDDFNRLSQQKLTDQVTFVQRMIELEQHHLENDLQEVDSAAAATLLTLLQGASS